MRADRVRELSAMLTARCGRTSASERGAPAPGAEQIERTLTRVAIQGDSASVQLRLQLTPTEALDEQLLLLRINGDWKITYKSYVPSTQGSAGT